MNVEKKLKESRLECGSCNGSTTRTRRPGVRVEDCHKAMKECVEQRQTGWKSSLVISAAKAGQYAQRRHISATGPQPAPCCPIVAFCLADHDWTVALRSVD